MLGQEDIDRFIAQPLFQRDELDGCGFVRALRHRRQHVFVHLLSTLGGGDGCLGRESAVDGGDAADSFGWGHGLGIHGVILLSKRPNCPNQYEAGCQAFISKKLLFVPFWHE